MLVFHALLTLFLLAVFYFDFTRYLIPNWICGVLLLIYPFMLMSSPALPEDFHVWQSIAVMVVVFAVGVGIFSMKWVGGGDVKLLAILSLWAGTKSVIPFVVYTGFLGGLLALLLVLVRPVAGKIMHTTNPQDLPRILRFKEPLPYGLAICTAFLILLWLGEIPGLPV